MDQLPLEVLQEILEQAPDAKTFGFMLLSCRSFASLICRTLVLKMKSKFVEKHIHTTPDGHVQAEYSTLPRGVLHGSYTTWFNNQSDPPVKQLKGHYYNGQKHGLFTEYYSTGKIHKIGNYLCNKKEGVWRTWMAGGQLYKKGMYRADRKEGEWTIVLDKNLVRTKVYKEGACTLKLSQRTRY